MGYMIDPETGSRRDADHLTEEQHKALLQIWNGVKDKTVCAGLKVSAQTLSNWKRSKAWQEAWRELVISDLQINIKSAVDMLKDLALKSDSDATRLKALNSWLDRAGIVAEGERSDVALQVNFANIELGDYSE